MIKSLLVSFLVTFALSAAAQVTQVQKVATFDFHNPETLTPAVDFKGGSVVDVAGVEFVSSVVTFQSVRTPKSLSPLINQNIKPGWCGFQFPARASMVVSVPTGYELLSIDLRQGFYNGVDGYNVETVPSDKTGTYYQGLWSAADADGNGLSGITSVTLTNPFGLDAVFSSVKVTYTSPADVLTYSAISPAADEETDPFTGFTLTFASKVKVQQGAVFCVMDADDAVVAMLSPSVSGTQLTLTPAKAITAPGSYKLSVSAGAIANEDGEYNKAFTSSFTVKDHPDSFGYTAISVDTGAVKELPQQVVLTFPSAIGTFPANLTFANAEATIEKTATLSLEVGNSANLVLDFGDVITDVDTLMCTIPANTIQAADGIHYNPEFILSYSIVGYDVPSAELVALADSLLNLSGVGYPKSNADERTALAAVVNGTNKTKQDYETAVTAYLNTTNIVLPAFGNYYTLAKKSAADAAEKTYLGYDGEFYATTEADAEHFLFVDIEGDRFIQMSDGTQAAVTLAKATDADPLKALGLLAVTIDGFDDQFSGIGYELTLTKSRDPKDLSEFLPATGTKTDELPEVTITVGQASSISYHPEKPIRILKSGNVVATITSATVSGNKLTFATGLTATPEIDSYTIDVPKGAITYATIDHEADVPALMATYELSTQFGFGVFTSKYSVFSSPSADSVYTPDDLNSANISSRETELFVTPDACVVTVTDARGVLVFTGTLVKDAESSLDTDGWSRLNYQFDAPFTRANMPDGVYTFTIAKGSFGDANYGAYLLDPASKEKKDCYVNGQLTFTYTVDYETATGIATVKAADPAAEVFDLAGRRVKGAVKAGVYVVDGKKVVVK